MKFTVLNVAAGLVLTAAIVSCNKDQPKTTTASTSTAADKPETSQQIVFVNEDSLLSNYEYFKDIKGKIESKSKKAQSDLQSKGSAFQREVAEYQKQSQTMSADERAATEQRLARKQQELAAYNQNAGAALQNDQAAENVKLYDKVADYLKDYAKKKGYKMVLSYSKANPTILFADASLDVTKDVVSGLNEAYKSEKK
ncbi:MAG: OmpH family outer membrane protein [Sphingobacteriaceae bacterium]|jgi:outer membrane protein|nr:OmpH family outer membrane protein [Sphingobacteriaceae bacterium]